MCVVAVSNEIAKAGARLTNGISTIFQVRLKYTRIYLLLHLSDRKAILLIQRQLFRLDMYIFCDWISVLQTIKKTNFIENSKFDRIIFSGTGACAH